MSTLATQDEKLEMLTATADPEGDEEEVEDDALCIRGTRQVELHSNGCPCGRPPRTTTGSVPNRRVRKRSAAGHSGSNVEARSRAGNPCNEQQILC